MKHLDLLANLDQENRQPVEPFYAFMNQQMEMYFIKGWPSIDLSKNEMKTMRRHMQMIFQDPYSSLNPRFKVLDIIGQALDIHRLSKNNEERKKRVEELLVMVGLEPVTCHALST